MATDAPEFMSSSSSVSWAAQVDIEMPAASAAPAISYASCTKKNLPPDQDIELSTEEREVYQRYLSSSKFEKDNFHPCNTPPDRPCSAFFNLPEHFTTTKDIFDGLLRDGFPASSVRCLQRLPNDGVLVSFSSEEVRNRFLRKSSLIIRKRVSVAHPASRRLTYVNVYDAPYELPDSAIEERLKAYGRVFSHRRGKCQEFPDIFNGVHHLRIALEDDIPCFLRFGRFQVRVKYNNQPKTCRKCNSPDHLAKDCQNTICFNCDTIGHLSRDCPDGMRCCMCKSLEHVAVDCPHSWYRRPQQIDPGNDPIADEILAENPVLPGNDVPPLAGGAPPALPPEGSSAAAHIDALSSAEFHVLDSQGMLLPNTPHADAVLADLFSPNDGDDAEFSTAEDDNGDDDDDDELVTEEENPASDDPDTETEGAAASSLPEDVPLATVFKKTRKKNVKKRLGDRLPQRGASDPGPPARKATRPTLVSRKARPK